MEMSTLWCANRCSVSLQLGCGAIVAALLPWCGVNVRAYRCGCPFELTAESYGMSNQGLQQAKMTPGSDKQPHALHLSDLRGECTAVDAQVISELLAVEWDVEFAGTVLLRLPGEVGDEPAADRFRGSVEHPAGERQIFPGRDRKEVLDEPCMTAAGVRAGMQHTSDIQKQDFAGGGGDGADH